MRSKKKSARSARVTAIGVMGLVLACLGAAILMASHQSSSEVAQMPAVDSPALQIAAEPTAKKIPAARTQAKVTVTASAVSAMPATKPAEVAAAAAPKAAAVESASRTVAAEPTPVTITGCLERDDTTFRLKDTTGTDAPKSRSWKSGFLKKGTASIDIVDAAHRLNLSTHVGQRVSVSGTLIDREMQVRSLQRVAASCD